MLSLARLALLFTIMMAGETQAQNMMGLDVTSDAFTKATMTRSELEAAIAKLPAGETLDLTGKSLNGLDLSGMDLRRTKLRPAT